MKPDLTSDHNKANPDRPNPCPWFLDDHPLLQGRNYGETFHRLRTLRLLKELQQEVVAAQGLDEWNLALAQCSDLLQFGEWNYVEQLRSNEHVCVLPMP